jgi:hypothetical protein
MNNIKYKVMKRTTIKEQLEFISRKAKVDNRKEYHFESPCGFYFNLKK